MTTLARRLKRTLQDNQNELLDRLRSNGSHWSVELLPDETEHLDAVATAAAPGLGAGGGGRCRRSPAPGARRSRTDVLWASPMSWPRPWWARCAGGSPRTSGLDGAEEAVVAEHVGSAFREWKGERIERLAGDHVVAAFSAGTIAAAEGAGRPAGVGGRLRLGGRPLPRLRGQRAERIPGGPARSSPPATGIRRPTPGVDASCPLRHLGCSRASPQ